MPLWLNFNLYMKIKARYRYMTCWERAFYCLNYRWVTGNRLAKAKKRSGYIKEERIKLLSIDQREFTGGKSAWTAAVTMAVNCQDFREDEEEEWVADDSRSCYNCRSRRCTRDSFVCLKQP